MKYCAAPFFALLGFALLAPPAGAHPHIFINTGLVFVIDDQNRLTHVQVTWEYDELYSLLITEDYGIDEDYDGILTSAEKETLSGFDMQWVEGFNGDLVGTLDGVPLHFSQPMTPTATLLEGKIITTHMRSVEGAPVVDGALVFRPYDGTYYSAYEVGLPVEVKDRIDCDIFLDPPDIEGALAMTKAEVGALPEDFDMEAAGLGDIGARFATKVSVTCGAP